MDMLYIEQDTVAGRQVAAAESVCVCWGILFMLRFTTCICIYNIGLSKLQI